MKPAIIIVDMLEDFISPDGPLPVGEEGLKIISSIKKLLDACREKSILIVYSNDALQPDDFLFQSRMKPHGIKDTSGAQLINELKPEVSDLVMHKPRFSAFFKTDLSNTLKERGIDTLVIGGVATEICVLSTAYDGICHGFRVIVLDDCCASRFKNTHHQIIAILKRSPLYPLLKIMTLAEFLLEPK
ncbi:cysteine hydrolase family protein [Chloroflexota bacterium]